MRRLTSWFSVAALMLAVLVLAGCGPAKKETDKGPKAKGEKHKDDHADEHGSGDKHSETKQLLHGPNFGHMVALFGADPKVIEYYGEWLTDDETGQLTIILLDKDGKNEVPTEAEVATVDVQSSEVTEKTSKGSTESYILKPVNRVVGPMPTATHFEVKDQKLITILAGDELNAKLRISIKDREYSGKFVQHKH